MTANSLLKISVMSSLVYKKVNGGLDPHPLSLDLNRSVPVSAVSAADSEESCREKFAGSGASLRLFRATGESLHPGAIGGEVRLSVTCPAFGGVL